MTFEIHQLYKNFYDTSHDMRIMVINNAQKFEIVNYTKKFLEISGYTDEDILDLRSMKSLYHPDCYGVLAEARALYVNQGFLHNYAVDFKTKDGNKISVYIDVLAVKDKEGNILFNHCLYKQTPDYSPEDVKAQQYLESLNKAFIEAQDTYQYFQDFYENAPDMFLSVAGDDLENVRVSHCNNTVVQKLGYTKEEILSMPLYELYHPDCRENAKELRKFFLKHGYISNWEIQLMKKNGEKIPVSLNSKSQKDSQGRTIRSFSMWRDITDLVETRRQLQETNELLTHQNEETKTLMHLMSHDIQAPIRAIENFTQFILDENKEVLPASTLSYVYKVQKNVRRLHHLTRDILSYYFRGSSANSANIEETSLKDIVSQVVTYLDLPPSTKINLKDNIQNFKAKRVLLSQIFYNLISNAVKYHHNPEQVEIYIEGSDNKTGWIFTVRDNGPGIPQEFHSTVFTPLVRLKSVREVEGSGLGLPIVKKLITQEGGKISLESGDGKGTMFIFTWPKLESTDLLNLAS